MSNKSLNNVLIIAITSISIFGLGNMSGIQQNTALAATTKFTQTGRMWPMSTSYKSGDEIQMAKFDIALENRWNNSLMENNKNWAAIKAINPNSEIYVYQEGTKTYNSMDDPIKRPLRWLNSIARWDNARGHSMGNLNTDNPDLFLLNTSRQRIEDLPAYPNSFKMDFGSAKFQTYWLEATKNDIINQEWKGDGIFLDDCLAVQGTSTYKLLSKYNSDATWVPAMNSFIQAMTVALHKQKQKIIVNRLGTGMSQGHTAWVDLDNSANPPDAVMEEIAFIREGALYYPESVWKLQVDILSKIHHSKVLANTYTNLKPGQTQTDSLGKPIGYWDILWFAWGSYQLGKNTIDNNSYFLFSDKTTNITWYDEYGIDLGKALNNYQIIKFDSINNVYWREFEKGFIYVNPTDKDLLSITLPEKCKQITHENINTINALTQIVSTINLASHRAAVLLKSAPNPPIVRIIK